MKTRTLAYLVPALFALACSDDGASSGGGGAAGIAGGSGTAGVAGLGGAAGAAGDSGAAGTAGAAGSQGTLYVEGRQLFDRCGEEVILRGVNEMIVWSPGKDGSPEFAEIAKTGANSVRIVWNSEGTAAQLDTAIANALAAQLLPIVEHHVATGDLTLLPTAVDYWTSAEVVAVLKKYEHSLLLNIANEAGDGTVTADVFQEAYRTAITRLRDAGLVLPLIIDAPQWGQAIDVLQSSWVALTEHDPEHNLLFSVHMWWADATGTRVTTELQESYDAGMPLMVGEFAQHAVYLCDQNPFAYGVLLTEAQRLGIGWLAWSWGSVPNNDCATEGSFDMTTDGVFGNWEETWAQEVAVTHAASIQNTSVRPHSLTAGSCL